LFPDDVIGNFHWRNLSGRTMAFEVDSISKVKTYQEWALMAAGA
jgi:hypothetical protein